MVTPPFLSQNKRRKLTRQATKLYAFNKFKRDNFCNLILFVSYPLLKKLGRNKDPELNCS